jgi:hypothetical protein
MDGLAGYHPVTAIVKGATDPDRELRVGYAFPMMHDRANRASMTILRYAGVANTAPSVRRGKSIE